MVQAGLPRKLVRCRRPTVQANTTKSVGASLKGCDLANDIDQLLKSRRATRKPDKLLFRGVGVPRSDRGGSPVLPDPNRRAERLHRTCCQERSRVPPRDRARVSRHCTAAETPPPSDQKKLRAARPAEPRRSFWRRVSVRIEGGVINRPTAWPEARRANLM